MYSMCAEHLTMMPSTLRKRPPLISSYCWEPGDWKGKGKTQTHDQMPMTSHPCLPEHSSASCHEREMVALDFYEVGTAQRNVSKGRFYRNERTEVKGTLFIPFPFLACLQPWLLIDLTFMSCGLIMFKAAMNSFCLCLPCKLVSLSLI